jgi:ketosteroid isomerase-like protein
MFLASMRHIPVVSDTDDVLAAAQDRANALVAGDAPTLRRLLHPDFHWISHTGAVFDLESYLRSNVGGPTRWHGQLLHDPQVIVAGDVAVLRCTVTDRVDSGDGEHEYRMLMSQTWILDGAKWRCLAGHAGPSQPAGDRPIDAIDVVQRIVDRVVR